MHWTLEMPSANALWLGEPCWKLARPICATSVSISRMRGFEFFLLPSRVHALLQRHSPQARIDLFQIFTPVKR
jgi:hypothetical protein